METKKPEQKPEIKDPRTYPAIEEDEGEPDETPAEFIDVTQDD